MQRKDIRWILACGVAALCLAGCRSVSAPPGFSGGTGGGSIDFPAGVSQQAQLALLSWYVETQGEAAERQASESLAVARNEQTRLWMRFRADSVAGLLRRYPEFLVRDAEGKLAFRPSVLARRTDWPAMEKMFAEIRAGLDAQHRISVPAAEAAAYLEGRKEYQALKSFREWAGTHLEIVLPEDSVRRLRMELDEIGSVVAQKKAICRGMEEAEGLLRDGACTAGLDVLDRMAKVLAANTSLALIGDGETLARFQELRKRIPVSFIGEMVRRLQGELPGEGMLVSSPQEADERLLVVERVFSRALKEWRSDARFQEALAAAMPECRSLAEMAAARRQALYALSLEARRKQRLYWTACREEKVVLAYLAEERDGELACYYLLEPAVGPKLEAQVRRSFVQMLPEALAHCRQAQEAALNLRNRFGLVVLLDGMLREMDAQLQSQKVSVQGWAEGLAKSRQAAERARALVREGQRIEVQVGDFTAATPSLGGTFADDLAHELGGQLRDIGLGDLYSVRRVSGEAPASAGRFCRLAGGRLAEYDGGAERVERTQRQVRRLGEPRLEANPSYVPAQEGVERPREGAVGSPERWVQEILLQSIDVESIERVAHVRFFFWLAEGERRVQIECNEFYRKKFVQENSRIPEQVHSVGTEVAYAKGSLKPADPLPSLRRDRVLSAGEVLDFARKDVVHLAGMRIVAELLAMPLRAVQAAPAGKDPLDAADQLGRAVVLLQGLALPGEPVKRLGFQVPLEAQGYAAASEALAGSVAELRRLGVELPAKAYQAAEEALAAGK